MVLPTTGQSSQLISFNSSKINFNKVKTSKPIFSKGEPFHFFSSDDPISVREVENSDLKTCSYCSEQQFIFRCEQFKAIDVKARFQGVKELKLCHRCLATQPEKSCKCSHTCSFCQYRHNYLLHFGKTQARNKANNGQKSPFRENKNDDATHDHFKVSSAMEQQDQDRESFPSNNKFLPYKTNSLGRDSSSALLPACMAASQSAMMTSHSSETKKNSGILLATMTDKLLNDSGVKLIERASLDPCSKIYSISGAFKKLELK